MKHYILTRFNLGLYGDNPYKITNRKKWMDRRIDLFNKLCLPSMLNQTCKDFTWVIALDPDTPLEYIRKIDYIDNVVICYEQPHLYLRSINPESGYILTSRLDNDDTYCENAVEELQKHARGQMDYIIDMRYYKTDGKTVIEDSRKRCNSPFLSLYEYWGDDICTAMGYSHTQMADHYQGVKLGFLATQNIHGRNILNSMTNG